MPEMDGLEVTRVIRVLPDFQQLPILAMTGGTNEDRKAYLSVGMNDFITKPVIPETLYSQLLFWLSRPKHSSDAPADIARLSPSSL